MLTLVSVEAMKRLEAETAALGLPGPALMENAGRAVADSIVRNYPPNRARSALVLVGPGNNGGDGLVVARHLHDAGYQVVIYTINRKLVDDAKERLIQQRHIPRFSAESDAALARFESLLLTASVVVDAVLGTGRARPIEDPLARIFDLVNAQDSAAVVAVDLPSGIDADTGAADPHAIRAVRTVTLGAPKRGLVLDGAARLAGTIEVADIGIPADLIGTGPVAWTDAREISGLLPERPRVSHKGSFGRVLVVGGSRLYTGAPVLATLGSQRSGAGLVAVATPDSVRASVAAHTIEATFAPMPDGGSGEFGPAAVDPLIAILPEYQALLIGPGIGRAADTSLFLERILAHLQAKPMPLVLDADALTLLSRWPRWWERLPKETILTPHPGEMSRLSGQSEDRDRIAWAVRSATTWGTIVVLKGAYTVIARPDGSAAVLPFATPALATAGTGDVLAGAVLGFLGQGLAPARAALVAAFAHGTAGDLVGAEIGPGGVLAEEVATALARAIEIIRKSDGRPLSEPSNGW